MSYLLDDCALSLEFGRELEHRAIITVFKTPLDIACSKL
jgi:hypothetical protein